MKDSYRLTEQRVFCLGDIVEVKCQSRSELQVQWGSCCPVCSQWKIGNLVSTAIGPPPTSPPPLDLYGGPLDLCSVAGHRGQREMDASAFLETCNHIRDCQFPDSLCGI